MIAATGQPRRNIGHLDTTALEAEAARLGKTLHVRAERGLLVLVLDVGADRELTADYWGTGGAVAQMGAKCCKCGRTLRDGESAWASDWTVLDVTGTTARWRGEVRYTCDGCERAAS